MSDAELTIDCGDEYYDDLDHRGRRAMLCYDPEDHRVYAFENIGPGVPEPVYHRRHRAWSLPACTGDSLRAWVAKHADLFAALREAYKGEEWDGHNNVGRWTDWDGGPSPHEDVQRALDEAGFETRWRLDDWIAAAPGQFRDDTRAALAKGRTVDEVTDEFLADAASDGAVIAYDEMHDYVQEVAEQRHCDCGTWSGEACKWWGPEDDMVRVEFMPDEHRASHEAAGNAGVYPANGAARIRVSRECADTMVEQDDWVRVLEEA